MIPRDEKIFIVVWSLLFAAVVVSLIDGFEWYASLPFDNPIYPLCGMVLLVLAYRAFPSPPKE